MSSFNVYLQRAMRLKDAKYAMPAKALNASIGYTDRLLSISATKMRNKLSTISPSARPSTAKKFVQADPRLIQRYEDKLKHLSSASSSTRIKTGLALGAGTLLYKAHKNLSETTPQTYDYSNYSSYPIQY